MFEVAAMLTTRDGEVRKPERLSEGKTYHETLIVGYLGTDARD